MDNNQGIQQNISLPDEYTQPFKLKDFEKFIFETVKYGYECESINTIEYFKQQEGKTRPIGFKAYDAEGKFMRLIYIVYDDFPSSEITLTAYLGLKDDLTDEEFKDGTITIIRLDKVNKGEKQV